jgi:cell division protein FtsN
MKKAIKFVFVLALLATVASACKSKQKVAEIPAGANIEATAPSTVVTPPPAPVVSTEPEVTRNESFSLSDGDQNAMKFKYHVVVGSFSKQTNAKGLQTTLNSEGNNAIIVVNEQGMYRVLIASFNQYSEARARINQIKSRFPDAWVLVQK